MSDILYSKLRIEVPQVLDGENATITSSRGATRTFEMSSPITDIMLPGMEKYRVQAGLTDEEISFGYGQIKKQYATYRSLLKRAPAAALSIIGFTVFAVIYRNEIHLVGSTSHYKWNGTSWVSASTLPEYFTGPVCVYNDEIHVFGGQDSNTLKNHYKWNGSSWTKLSNMPINIRYGDGISAVPYVDGIHIFRNYDSSVQHYRWDNGSWTKLADLPYNVFKAVVYDGDIHLLGGGNGTSGDYRKHYKYNRNSNTYTQVSTLPTTITGFGMGRGNHPIVYNNELYIIGSAYYASSYWSVGNAFYKYEKSNNTWTKLTNPPFTPGGDAIAYKANDAAIEEIVVFGSSGSGNDAYLKLAQWNPIDGWLEITE